MEIEYQALLDFLACPALYLFKHQRKDKVESYMGRKVIDDILTNTIYFFYNTILEEERIPSETELKNFYGTQFAEKEDLLKFKTSQQKKRYTQKYPGEFIKKFYIKHRDNPGIPIAVNEKFDVELENHKIKNCNLQLVKMVDKKTHIMYFSNASHNPDTFRKNNDLKFSLMSYGFRNIFKQKEDKFIYNSVRKGKFLEIYRSNWQFKKMVATLDNIAEIIDQELYWQNINYLCKACAYSDICYNWRGR